MSRNYVYELKLQNLFASSTSQVLRTLSTWITFKTARLILNASVDVLVYGKFPKNTAQRFNTTGEEYTQLEDRFSVMYSYFASQLSDVFRAPVVLMSIYCCE